MALTASEDGIHEVMDGTCGVRRWHPWSNRWLFRRPQVASMESWMTLAASADGICSVINGY
jgi:hypothetical protein